MTLQLQQEAYQPNVILPFQGFNLQRRQQPVKYPDKVTELTRMINTMRPTNAGYPLIALPVN